MDLAKRLAKNLRKWRGDMTQGQYARKLGISRPTLNRLENPTGGGAGQNTTLKTLQKITKSLKCNIAKLFE